MQLGLQVTVPRALALPPTPCAENTWEGKVPVSKRSPRTVPIMLSGWGDVVRGAGVLGGGGGQPGGGRPAQEETHEGQEQAGVKSRVHLRGLGLRVALQCGLWGPASGS